MTRTVSCPYCNASFVAEFPISNRLTCPRCQESFTLRNNDSLADTRSEQSALPEVTQSFAVPSEPKSWSLKTLAAIGGALGIVVFAIGLWLQSSRTSQPSELEVATKNLGAGPATLPPTALSHLRFLAPESSIVAAIQFRPLQTYATLKEQTPQQLLTSLGLPKSIFAALEQAGLTIDKLDVLLAGMTLAPDNLIPRVILVIRTMEPIDNERDYLKSWKPERYRGPDGENQYKAQLAGLPVRVRKIDSHSILVVTEEADLNRKPNDAIGADHFAPGLKESLGIISPASLAWIVSDNDDWTTKPSIQAILKMTKQDEQTQKLKQLRSFAIGWSLEPNIRATIGIRSSETDASKMRDTIALSLAGRPVEIGGSGSWTTIETDPENLLLLLPQPVNPSK